MTLLRLRRALTIAGFTLVMLLPGMTSAVATTCVRFDGEPLICVL